ncbi:MAG TPA: hypothetical protein VF855_14860 [Acidimicrobiales bacterium]
MRRTMTAAILVAALVGLMAAPAGAAVDRNSYHVYTADAIFRAEAPGGIVTDVDVTIVVGDVSGTVPAGLAPPVLIVELWVSDDDVEVRHAVGIAELLPDDYTFDTARLTFASVDANVMLVDEGASGGSLAAVHVGWEAWGRYDVEVNVAPMTSDTPHQFIGRNRAEMVAEGTVIEGVTNHTPEPTNGGFVKKVEFHEVSVGG